MGNPRVGPQCVIKELEQKGIKSCIQGANIPQEQDSLDYIILFTSWKKVRTSKFCNT
jgi:hypothetical protein